jgi:hypothetical protein
VEVEVVYGLAAVFSCVDDYAIAVQEALLAGDFGCGCEQVAEQWAVCRSCFGQGCDVFAGHDEYVDRGLRVDIRKCVALLVGVDRLRGDGSVDYFAEKTVHDELSLLLASIL